MKLSAINRLSFGLMAGTTGLEPATLCRDSWSGTLPIVAPSHRLRKIEATDRISD
jgi:hypothetical protein